MRRVLGAVLAAVMVLGVLAVDGEPVEAQEVLPSPEREIWCNSRVATWHDGGADEPYIARRGPDGLVMRAAVTCRYDPTSISITALQTFDLYAESFNWSTGNPALSGVPGSGNGSTTTNVVGFGVGWFQARLTMVNGSGSGSQSTELNGDRAVPGAGSNVLWVARIVVNVPLGESFVSLVNSPCPRRVSGHAACPVEYADEEVGWVAVEYHTGSLPAPAMPPPPPVWPVGGEHPPDAHDPSLAPAQVACRGAWSDGSPLGFFELGSHVTNPVAGATDSVSWKVRERSTGRVVHESSTRDTTFTPGLGGVGVRWVATVSVRRTMPFTSMTVPSGAVGEYYLGPDLSGPSWYLWLSDGTPAPDWLQAWMGGSGEQVLYRPDGSQASTEEMAAWLRGELRGTTYQVVAGEGPTVAVAATTNCSVPLQPGMGEDIEVVTPPGSDPDDDLNDYGGDDPPEWWPEEPGDWPGDGGGDGGGECEGVGGWIPIIGGVVEGVSSLLCALFDLIETVMRLLGELIYNLFVPKQSLADRWAALGGSLSGRPPWSLITATSTAVGGVAVAYSSAGGCEGVSYDVVEGEDIEIPCEPAVAGWSGMRGLMAGALVITTALMCWAMVSRSFGGGDE